MNATPRFVFRCDAGPSSGAGHFMRQLAIAQRARAHGPTTMIVPREGAPLLAELDADIEGVVVPALTAEDEAEWLLDRFGRASFFVDSYTLAPELYARLSSSARCIAFEDGERALPASLLVKPRPESAQAPRGVLEGCRYIPVRTAFTDRPSRPRDGRHLVVCFGASDPTGGTATALARLPEAPLDGWRVSVVQGPLAAASSLPQLRQWSIEKVFAPDMAELLDSADAAIVAAGSIVWELAALGVPTMAFSVVGNQDRNARWLGERGCIGGGWRLGRQPIAELTDVAAFLTDAAWRASLGRTLARHVDGRGADRIIDAALSLQGDLR